MGCETIPLGRNPGLVIVAQHMRAQANRYSLPGDEDTIDLRCARNLLAGFRKQMSACQAALRFARLTLLLVILIHIAGHAEPRAASIPAQK
jgi:hypothetical protein